jgi:hypothetical protein
VLDSLRKRNVHIMKRLFPIVEAMVVQSARGDSASSSGRKMELLSRPYTQLVRKIYDQFVEEQVDATVSMCVKDVRALIEFVTWDTEDRAGGAQRALSEVGCVEMFLIACCVAYDCVAGVSMITIGAFEYRFIIIFYNHISPSQDTASDSGPMTPGRIVQIWEIAEKKKQQQQANSNYNTQRVNAIASPPPPQRSVKKDVKKSAKSTTSSINSDKDITIDESLLFDQWKANNNGEDGGMQIERGEEVFEVVEHRESSKDNVKQSSSNAMVSRVVLLFNTLYCLCVLSPCVMM